MIDIGFKPVVFNEGLLKRLEVGFRQIQHAAAFGTDQVVMPAIFPGMVTHYAVTHAYFGRQSELFQKFKRAVDRGNIGVGVFLTNTLENLLCADMAFGPMKRIDYHYTLRGKTVSLLQQSFCATHNAEYYGRE
jgi:hypothetical protein